MEVGALGHLPAHAPHLVALARRSGLGIAPRPTPCLMDKAAPDKAGNPRLAIRDLALQVSNNNDKNSRPKNG